MGQAYRILRVAFEDAEALVREYEGNLVNGGLFLPGYLELLYGEPVMVLVDLPFADTAIELEGRVAQTIPREFESGGGRPGVALELSESPEEIRARLAAATGLDLGSPGGADQELRSSARSRAHVRAQVRVPGVSEIEGQTRNLSLAGVLVAIVDDPPPVGQEVRVAIVHPTTGEERVIDGIIARHDLDESGCARGVGVQFLVEPGDAEATIAYLSQVKASEHARRLGGITGSIDTLGLPDLILSFGQCVPSGRFTLMRGGEVGTVHVAGGMMTAAQMGAAVGVKALVRMAAWEDGSFEFHANLEPAPEEVNLAMPIEAALLEAARLVDESRVQRSAGLPPRAALRVVHHDVDVEDPALSKVESQILDRAGAGMNVMRVLDTIQEPDGLIERTILDLVERGALSLEEAASGAGPAGIPQHPAAKGRIGIHA